MSWLEFLSVIIPSLSWPTAIIIVAWLFASELPKLLPRLHKVGPAGVELYPHAPEQKRADGEIEAELSELQLDPLNDSVAAELEANIFRQVEAMQPEEHKPRLVRALTEAQMTKSFALAYANIFGSQIAALEKLNSQSISREEANDLFMELKASDPVFWGDLTLNQYLQFLFDWKFIDEQNGQLSITTTGKNFLQFIVYSGLSKERLH